MTNNSTHWKVCNCMLHSFCIPSASLDKNISYEIHDLITDAVAGMFSGAFGHTVFWTVVRLL